jgi:hypothetical protein
VKASLGNALRLLLVAVAITIAARAGAGQLAAYDTCSLYGFARGPHAYAVCRMNVRHYWSTGPCGDSRFASMHRGYCHLDPPLDF